DGGGNRGGKAADVAADPGETRDLSADRPDAVRSLARRLDAALAAFTTDDAAESEADASKASS
ncbi:MAG: hypothetical protein ACPGVX_11110, partial [Thalassobaculaceae bacterium]